MNVKVGCADLRTSLGDPGTSVNEETMETGCLQLGKVFPEEGNCFLLSYICLQQDLVILQLLRDTVSLLHMNLQAVNFQTCESVFACPVM